jgi:hypothetical protein
MLPMQFEHFLERWWEWIRRAGERLRTLSWRQLLHGLLTSPLSVSIILGSSVLLFIMVLFVALPSARIRVWPKVGLVSHTANVLLVLSGASIPFERQHMLLLFPLRATVQRTLTFTEISKEFVGENAEVAMTMINESPEPASLRRGTRLVNQAGMIFRTLDGVEVPGASSVEPGMVEVRAQAEPEDIYGQIIGERGNVPAGLKWELPGLALEEQKFLYARNLEEARGGRTEYGQRLRTEDLELAKKQLEQELLRTAKVRTEEEVEFLRARTGEEFVILQYDVLTSIGFSGFTLPTHLVGESLESVPIEGALDYQVLAYSRDALLQLLLPELEEHIEQGYTIVPESTVKEGISVHVIEYDDNLRWVKITAELTGKQHAVLTPMTPSGRMFGEKVREAILGKSVEEAQRIIQNFPEVESVEVSVWPPWKDTLPSLVSNIVLLPQE